MVDVWPGSSPFCLEKKEATALFSLEDGGTLRMPGSDVVLRVPHHAVPKGETYVVYGRLSLVGGRW